MAEQNDEDLKPVVKRKTEKETTETPLGDLCNDLPWQWSGLAQYLKSVVTT